MLVGSAAPAWLIGGAAPAWLIGTLPGMVIGTLPGMFHRDAARHGHRRRCSGMVFLFFCFYFGMASLKGL
ncbi:hypothetical protein RchiOBHm_Chr5g0077561 [Rosa chinensis]|uniref:Uncharacterized protein n=1 Tax=Rosa chinensis TaxID=74649 RepID=A0A2P6QM05_ROSCH|nr:hypothetical protein RchiOBHm_Chr5g0077561 [Rosa chinensis]